MHFSRLFLWLAPLLLSLNSVAQREEITNFASEIVVRANGDLIVTETITVISTGDRIQRGIFRDFPTRYPARFGLRRRVDLDVLGVQRNGKPEPWVQDWSAIANGVRLYIGNSEILLPPGSHTYSIRYQTSRQLVQRDEFDELYWNVTGNDWAFPIAMATATVRLPDGIVPLSIDAYTGPSGSTGSAWRRAGDSDSRIVLETTSALAPREGFTISVAWPKGFIDPNANPNDVETLVRDNLFTAFGIVLLIPVVLYYLIAWYCLGRDPPQGVIVPQYGPPAGFSPSAVRFVAGFGRIDQKSFASAVLQLAVCGALRVVQGNGFTLINSREGRELAAGQRRFLATLFRNGGTLEIEKSNHATLIAARKALAGWLRNDFEKAYFRRNLGVWLVGLLLSLLPAGLALLDTEQALVPVFILFWLAFWTQGTTALISSALSSFRDGKILSGIPRSLMAVPFLIGWLFGVAILFVSTSPWVIAIFVIGAGLNLLFYHLLKAPTLQGRAVLDQIEGFKHYLGVAERDRLNLENPPDRTPELFEKFLPYALALDVEQSWAEQFSDILEAANYEPAWFTGNSHFSSLGTVGLASSLGGSMSSAIASSSTAPGSASGSAGGGSSGGGGGGGGGGGW